MAWHPLGWKPAFFSEIEPFPCAVLQHHYPNVHNYGDMTKFQEWPNDAIDLLVGGTPCQSFSVAGLRAGLDDPRGNLTLVYLAVVARYRSRWVVWENVPGVLSDRTGAFGAFLGGLADLGYGFAHRVLDAQYFGLAQRRRRVFVVGHLGDWRPAAAVLFERESLSGNPAPRRKARKRVAASLDQSPYGNSNQALFSQHGDNLVRPDDFPDVVGCLSDGAHMGGGLNGQDAYTGRIIPQFDRGSVRRLTPRECERLQGFPDDYTLVPYRNRPASDGPRYKALGNSMAVNVMAWIGKRIARCSLMKEAA